MESFQRRGVRTGGVLAALMLVAGGTTAAPAIAQAPDAPQLDTVRIELVRTCAFAKGSDTQLTKALNADSTEDAQRTELIRSRGFTRAAITQCGKTLALLDRAEAPPDTVITPEPEAPIDARAFILGPQVPIGTSAWAYFDEIQESDLVKWAGRYLAGQSGGDTYYDLPWALYQLHARTGDPAHLELAQAVAAKYWASLATSTGWTAKPNPFSVAPRTLPFAGLLLYALEGGGAQPQHFTNRHSPDWAGVDYALLPWLEGWIRAEYPNWLGRRLANDRLWAGLRDGSMLLADVAQMAVAHPDSSVRAEMRQMAHDAAVKYYVRLQYPDGSWRWNPGSGDTQRDSASQPFQVALTLEALTQVHMLTQDSAVLAALVRGGEAWYRDTYDQTEALPHLPGVKVRGALYISYGDACSPPITPSMPTCGNDLASAASPWEARNKIKVIRHRNTFAPFPLAYTCHVTGDQRFCEWATDVFGATFGGELGGPGADGLTAVMPGNKGKEVNQLFRTAGRALWYLRPR